MNFSKFRNKKIYLAPYTVLTQNLANHLLENYDIETQGYIDNTNSGKNIYTKDDINNLYIDKIFILSPNWDQDIYDELKNFISANKLIILEKQANSYKKSILSFSIVQLVNKISIHVVNNLFEFFNIKIIKSWAHRIGEFCLENEGFIYKLDKGIYPQN